jgi:hypothetical protein
VKILGFVEHQFVVVVVDLLFHLLPFEMGWFVLSVEENLLLVDVDIWMALWSIEIQIIIFIRNYYRILLVVVVVVQCETQVVNH